MKFLTVLYELGQVLSGIVSELKDTKSLLQFFNGRARETLQGRRVTAMEVDAEPVKKVRGKKAAALETAE